MKRREGGSFSDWRWMRCGVAVLAGSSLIMGCGLPEGAPSSAPVGLTTASTGLLTTTDGFTTTTEATATTPEGANTAEPTSTTPTPTTTTTDAASTTTATPIDDGMTPAIDSLTFITVENEHVGGYVRDLFGYPADLNGDGCDTRADVLKRDSITPAQVSTYGCTVVQGDWLSLYDGLSFSIPGDLQIDHAVPLKEAWDSGAWNWSGMALVAYGNDLTDRRGLAAVSTSTNISKGDKDPSNWLPPDQGDVCRYIGDWVSIKIRWGLSMDQSEFGRIRNLLNGPCVGWRIAPLVTLPASTAPAPAAPPTAPVDPSQPPAAIYYKNCAAVRAAGAAPLHIGDPGYRTGLDGDKDGVACE